MKKFLPILLFVVSLFILLTACSTETPSSTIESTASSLTTTLKPTETTTKAPAITTETVTTTVSVTVSETPVKLMTFNLRYDTTSHPAMATDVRGAHLMEVIDKYQPDSVGFNEATNAWMNYLRDAMKERGYEYVGLGRDTGKDGPSYTGSKDEHCPVFYRSDKYDLIDSGNFWMSYTPEIKVTSAWNSACNRICSYVVLKNKETGEIYAHLGTHLDHVSVEAQVNSVAILETYVRAILEKHGDIGIVLTGDFNAVSFDQSDPDYIPTTYNSVTAFMDDALTLAKKIGVFGSTFCGYQNPVDWENGLASDKDKPAVNTDASAIDFIFLKKDAYSVSYYTVVDDAFTFEHGGKTWHNHPISDHYGVYAEVVLRDPTVGFIKDDTKLVDHKASISTNAPATLPPKILEGFTLSSSLDCVGNNVIDNLLLDDESVATAAVSGSKHGYWEITATFSNFIELQGISFTTASSKLPFNARVFVSNDLNVWKQVGHAYDDPLSPDTAYYLMLDEAATVRYVKIIFSDCVTGVKLRNLSLYGQNVDVGHIENNRITLIEGPKSGEKEGYEKLFDGDRETKFYIRLYKDNETPKDPDPVPPIYFSTDTPTTIRTYQLTNAADTPKFSSRLPRKWTLYASLDGSADSYVMIDQEIAPTLSSEQFKTFTFTVDAPGEYRYYKLVFDTVGTTGNMQFSEIAFFEKVW